ncbi:2Fe-2S iron-sulfur cluster binding domain-containing protein [Spiractinospora alimapuensis]|uniref:2Fe-2S iron-sulfur cluster-binding protein n=1 Tax=Spiractinospora alimapuensis TaxID=2820884 RepID=UPI001F2CB789|nr:2Fe-2S iron-sulfur cluster-binding protein [Spiractinospora alimapuensis]QVQ50189.1 2Fe-2S iron-sulfur cluster binding domain-containing protein [Spiractinospora alimapuensis]
MKATLTLRVDGEDHTRTIDTRTTLLDALRETLGVTSPKKGCGHGQCGSCTVLVDGRRMVSCLTFAVAHDGANITTAAGLSRDGELHPVARAFLRRDALQCGFCTPGQICSTVAMLEEVRAGWPSHATEESGSRPQATPDERRLGDAEIRERLSGNLCRCGAYVNIVAAVKDVAE